MNYTKNEVLAILSVERERVAVNYYATKNSNFKKEMDDLNDIISLLSRSRMQVFYNIREVNRIINNDREIPMINVGDLIQACFLGIADHSQDYNGYDIKYLSRKGKTTKYKKPTIVFSRGKFYEYNAGGYCMGVLE